MGVPILNSHLHRAVLAAMMVPLLAACTFAAPLGTPPPSGGAAPTAVATALDRETPGPDATPTARPARTPKPVVTPQPTPQPTDETALPDISSLLGTDGRFTILLLGVDSRTRQLNGRTDTIMFVTINPKNGKVSMASLPRDMVFVPYAPGKTYGSGYTRINALFAYLAGYGGGRKATFKRMVQAMEYTSGIEIDRYAMIGFHGVRNLIDEIGGVDVTLARPLNDQHMHVVMKGQTGLVLKAGKNHLNGNVALAFARTRETDSDYERGRRQQALIIAAIKKVIKRGPEALPALLDKFSGLIKTDIDLADAPAFLALAERAKLGDFKSTILGPTKFAGPGDVQYATKLKIDVVRAFFQQQFGPVRN
jgi:LCP family protein required for cell wall assembly